MKMSTIKGLIFLLIISCIPVLYADEPTVILQVNENSPYWSEKKSSGGMGSEIVQAISKEMGIKTRIQFIPLKRLIADTSNNDVGNPLFYMSNQDFAAIIPIAISYASLFSYHKDGKKTPNNMFQKDKRIGVLMGTADNIESLSKFGKFEESYSKESLFKKLKAGRVDTVLDLNLAGREIIQKLFPTEIDYFDVHIIPESGAPIAIMIDSNYPDGAMIGKRFQEGLHRILENGVYQKILKKYNPHTAVPIHYFTDLSKFESLYSSDSGGNGL